MIRGVMARQTADRREQPSTYTRYCPGQEHSKISDAVCLGRRRRAYVKCAGCPFNDDEKAAVRADGSRPVDARVGLEAMLDEVVKAYDVRGIYPDPLNEDVAWRLGHATAQFLLTALTGFERGDAAAHRLVVGRDMRKSSPSLARALIDGVRSTGAGVIDIGMIDTSQIYFAINHFDTCGGVQVTASHNPPQYNGFKISGRGGKPVSADTGLLDIKRIAEKMKRHETGTEGSIETADLTTPYKQFVRQHLRPLKRPLKIVVDASNGMAGKWVPLLFDDVKNLELVPLNMTHDGEFAHDPNPLVDANLRQLQDEVRRTGADAGACFDGDADRCMFINERAEIIRCDILTALLAREFLRNAPGAAIVYDLRCSRVVAEEIEAAGGTPVRERVGHVFMKKTLAENDGVFGGELSGHFYFKDNWFCDSGMLAFAHVVNVLSSTDAPLSARITPLERFFGSGERNFENAKQDATIAHLAEVYAGAEIDDLDGITVQYEDWWFNVRQSNTEPLLRLNLEANTAALLAEKLEEVGQHLGTPVAH